MSVGFSLGFCFLNLLVNCFLVVFFFLGGVGFFGWLVVFWILRVNNSFIVTLTLSAPGVWMKRGAIDEVKKKEGNC